MSPRGRINFGIAQSIASCASTCEGERAPYLCQPKNLYHFIDRIGSHSPTTMSILADRKRVRKVHETTQRLHLRHKEHPVLVAQQPAAPGHPLRRFRVTGMPTGVVC